MSNETTTAFLQFIAPALVAGGVAFGVAKYSTDNDFQKQLLIYEAEKRKIDQEYQHKQQDGQIKRTEIDVKILELAIGILRSTPDKNSKNPLRVWAAQVLSEKSGFPLSSELLNELAMRIIPIYDYDVGSVATNNKFGQRANDFTPVTSYGIEDSITQNK